MTAYFSQLNYSLANEDSRVERSLCAGFTSALSVCGSGSRAFSLIQPGLKKLIIVDISAPQLAFAKFKWELIRTMTYENYLTFMGYVFASLEQRLDIIESVDLGASALHYYRLIPESNIDNGIVYSGRWESIMIKLGKLITGLCMHDFHKNFLQTGERESIWPRKRLQFFVGMFANSWILDNFVYKGQMVKEGERTLVDVLNANFEYRFLRDDPKKSFFHQMLFLGEIKFPEGFPIYLAREVFEEIKNYNGDIEFHQMDLGEAVKSFDFEFGSFSNVPSYLTERQNAEFEINLLDRLNKGTRRIVSRSFLRHRGVKNRDLRARLDIYRSQLAEQQDVTGLYQFQIL